MSRIAIKHVKELAEKSNQQIVIVFGFDKDSVSHVATWGKTSDDCSNAADLGNKMKKGLGWPESLCDTQPSRVRKLRKEIAAKDEEIERLCAGWMEAECRMEQIFMQRNAGDGTDCSSYCEKVERGYCQVINDAVKSKETEEEA